MLLVLLCACFLGLTNGIVLDGWHRIHVSLSDPNVQNALNVIKASPYGNGTAHLGVLKVINAQAQTVSGKNLKLKLQMTNGLVCTLTFWLRPWLNSSESTRVTQGPDCRQVRIPIGGISLPKSVNPNDAQVMSALHFANCYYNDQTNSMYATILGNLSGTAYTEQVVAGLWYRFEDVPLLDSYCLNKGCAALPAFGCQVQQNSPLSRTCSFSIVDQAWMIPRYTMESWACN